MVFEKIRDVICEQLNVQPENISPETSFEKDLKADSLDLFQVIMALEEAFGMEFSVDMTKRIKTVGDAADYIEANKR